MSDDIFGSGQVPEVTDKMLLERVGQMLVNCVSRMDEFLDEDVDIKTEQDAFMSNYGAALMEQMLKASEIFEQYAFLNSSSSVSPELEEEMSNAIESYFDGISGVLGAAETRLFGMPVHVSAIFGSCWKDVEAEIDENNYLLIIIYIFMYRVCNIEAYWVGNTVEDEIAKILLSGRAPDLDKWKAISHGKGLREVLVSVLFEPPEATGDKSGA